MTTELTSEPHIVGTLKELVNAFNQHDLDAIMNFFAEDCTLDMPRGPDPWGSRLHGRRDVREGLFPTDKESFRLNKDVLEALSQHSAKPV